MADNKPALFPITAFIVSYHYARSDGLCVTRVTVYDLFIATPPSPPSTHDRNALYTLATPPPPPLPLSPKHAALPYPRPSPAPLLPIATPAPTARFTCLPS